jgi:hypothetical protein
MPLRILLLLMFVMQPLSGQILNIAYPLLPRAHAHNDYRHARPLEDALAHGFTSIEADIWLISDSLMVAHDRHEVEHNRSLEKLYLQPLARHIKENNGQVFKDSSQLTLLIDQKSAALPTYRALHDLLFSYRHILTIYENGNVRPAPVRIVVSGNRPQQYMLQQAVRLATYDGRVEDLQKSWPLSFMWLISGSAPRLFVWRGEAQIPEADRQLLADILHQAHSRGRKVRFWATPDQPGQERFFIWTSLYAAGVDYLNTDDLNGLRNFLIHKQINKKR